MGHVCSLEQDDIMPLRPEPHQPKKRRGGASSSVQTYDYAIKDRAQMDSDDLFQAVMAGDARRVKWALQAQADPNADSDPTKFKPLHICAAQDHVPAAQLLIEYEADVAAVDNKIGMSPLSMACEGGHVNSVQLLVCASAPLDGPEGDGSSPLLHAAFGNHAQVCEILVGAGAFVSVAMRRSAEPDKVREIRERRNIGGDWKSVLYGTGHYLTQPLMVEGVTPLHMAAAHGNARVCQCLLAAGARASVTDVLLRSPLMLAGERGHVEVTALLLEHQAAVGCNADGHSVATMASRAGHVRIIQLLLQYHAADPNFVSWAGAPAMLHMAAQYAQGGCISVLCESRADVDITLEPGGVTPLMVAAAKGHGEICRELLAYGVSLNDPDADGKTAWLHAAMHGRGEICQLLATHGATEAVKQAIPPADMAEHRRSSAAGFVPRAVRAG